MNVVDSSGWLEYFANGLNADFFTPAIEDTNNLIVPVISIFEVFKRILQQRSEDEAIQVVALMQQGQVIDLNISIALQAAKVSIDYKLPLADSMIFATAIAYEAVLWTQDIDFAGLPNIQYKAKNIVL